MQHAAEASRVQLIEGRGRSFDQVLGGNLEWAAFARVNCVSPGYVNTLSTCILERAFPAYRAY